MPRRNRHKKEPQKRAATMFDNNFKQGCYGCAFAGQNFVCMTSTGKCLKTKPELAKEEFEKKQETEKTERNRRKSAVFSI